MIIRICAFTDRGRELAVKLEREEDNYIWEHRSKESNIDVWVEDSFKMRAPIVFIGAVGIAVRKIAPFVADKLSDSPVLVIDESGAYVIPILSGHVGGANALSKRMAGILNAQEVITTATDVEKLFAVDVFAVKNGLKIVNRDGIKKVSSKLLAGGRISIALPKQFEENRDNRPACVDAFDASLEENADVIIKYSADVQKPTGASVSSEELVSAEASIAQEKVALLSLEPKPYVLGIGCKKETDKEKLEAFICKILEDNNIAADDVCSMASIDLKQKEYAINYFETKYRIPFYTYTADELEAVEGEYVESAFVKSITGVSNVCERAAMKLAGEGAELVVHKTAYEGMTVAVAKKKSWRIEWET